MNTPSPETAASYSVETRSPVRGKLDGDFNPLFTHWSDIKGENFAPSWRDFDWQLIPSTLIPWVAVIDVSYDPLDFIYRYWGTARTRTQGKDFTGKSIRDFRPVSISEKAMKEYTQVVEEKVPLHLITTGLTNHVNEPFSYQFLRLPFSYDGIDVHQVLGVGLYDAESTKRAADFYGTSKD